MTARVKKTPHVASSGGLLTGWARQGARSFVAAQKILLDLVAQENALLIGMVRERLSKPGFRPGITVAGIADSGVKNLTSAGKILLDLAAGQTALAVDGVKEGLRLPAAVGVVADVARHRVHTLIDLQKSLLDATAEQAHALAESYRDGRGLPAAATVAELARRGIEGFVESEKKFLDLAAHEVSVAAKGDKRKAKAPRKRMEVLTAVAREGAEKYIDTQKKLFDLAIDQIEATTKSRREIGKKTARKQMRPSWGELTEKSVKNIVTAEKSLLELAGRPIRGTSHKESRKVARARRVAHHPRKKHATGARAAAIQAA